MMSDETYVLAEHIMNNTSYSIEEVSQGIQGVFSMGLDLEEVELMCKEFASCA